jgi:hypothetical protein
MNIAIINQSGGKYLFEVPESITLKEGEKVKCDTKHGVTDGTVWADSITADEPTAKLIGKLLGAKFPLKSVVGKLEYQPFEKPQDKPAANPANKYEGMSNKELDLEMCAKKGACNATHNSRRKNDCPLLYMERCDITDANRAEVIEYLLAEDAEAEPEPEYYSGKVVCVEATDRGVTLGRVYTVEKGVFTWNNGEKSDTKATTIEQFNNWFVAAKFIEFKGE